MTDPVVLLSTGDVVGPNVSTDGTMVLFDGTSGKKVKGNNAVVTAQGLALLDDADPAANRATIGLNLVNNTSDLSKPISTLTQSALDGKQPNLGYTPVQQGTGINQTGNTVKFGWDGVWLRATVDASDLGRLWTVGNFDPSVKVNGDYSTVAGFFSGAKASPYMQHSDGTQVLLQVAQKDIGVVSDTSNLRITTDGTTGQAVISASSVFLSDGTGRGVYKVLGVTANIATVGLGGLDTGTVAVNTFYHVYAISNGSLVNIVFSLNATTPALPGGYTMFARIGAVRTGAVANVLMPTVQRGPEVQYDPKVSSNLLDLIQLGAVAGSIGVSAISLASVVPTTAVAVDIVMQATASGGNSAIGVYPRASSNNMSMGIIVPAGGNNSNKNRLLLSEAGIYWATSITSSGTCRIYCAGWRDSL